MTHCSAIGLKPAIVASPECRALPTSGEKARSEYHFAVKGTALGRIGLSACGQNVASSAMDHPTEGDQRPQRIGRERIISNRKAAERGCKQWLACRQTAALPLQPLWADLRKCRLRNFFGPGNEVHAGGKVDDNANLSHENPGPEETCDVGAIEKARIRSLAGARLPSRVPRGRLG